MLHRPLALMVIFFAFSAFVWAETGESAEQKDAVLPVILNVVPGFGVGSFMIGDPVSGLIGLGGEAVGVGLFSYGFVTLIFSPVTGVNAQIFEGVAAAGIVLYLAAKVYGVVSPFVFADDYNRRLKAASNPQVVVTSERTGTGLVLRFRY